MSSITFPVNKTQPPADGPTIAQQLSAFANQYSYASLPAQVAETAKGLILDSLGCALAATSFDFPHRILGGLRGIGEEGHSSVIGLAAKLPMRDAALMNGALIHGLDFDDSHLGAVLHPGVSSLVCALAVGEKIGASGQDLIAAYVLGVENVVRIAMAANGGFHHAGYHPTGLAAHFSCALTASWLYGLNERQMTMAQGLAGSTAAGTQEFLSEGAWNKRLHPGWAAVGGITAANLARTGTVGPTKPYEGRLGVYNTHLQQQAETVDYRVLTKGLGTEWELMKVAVKPFPACHFVHACGDSALVLQRKHGIDPAQIERIQAFVAEPTKYIIAEPAQSKKRPANDYEAKFSVQFFVAACLTRGQFGFAEMTAESLKDPAILALAEKVDAVTDTKSLYPTYCSGGVTIRMKDGTEYSHHEPINRGAGDRAMTRQEIEEKFFSNARLAVSQERAKQVRDAVYRLDQTSVREFAAVISGR